MLYSGEKKPGVAGGQQASRLASAALAERL
jgi:hypothetical protein